MICLINCYIRMVIIILMQYREMQSQLCSEIVEQVWI